MIACLHRRDQAWKLKRGEYKYLEWASNGTLQLQRLAYQGISSGKWSGYTDDIPMTESGALLGDLTQSYPEVALDQEQGPFGPAGKTQATAVLQAVTVASADGSSEATTGGTSSNASDAASTLVPGAGYFNPVPGPQPTPGDGVGGEGGRHLHRQTASLGSVPGLVTLGSGADLVSPVPPLPTQLAMPTVVPRDAIVVTSEGPQQRGTSSSHQVINS